jgi:phage repressor protein C with HTH and peptisase S24 domain
MADSRSESSFGDRLYQAVERSELDRSDVWNQAGISQKTFQRYLKREDPPSTDRKKTDTAIKRICQMLGVRRAWLIEGEPPMSDRNDTSLRKNDSSSIDSLFKDTASLEVLTEVKASAGGGRVNYPDEARHRVEVPRHFIAQIIGFMPPRRVGVMFAEGDSMRPTIEDDEMILYKPAEDVASGGIYVLWRDSGLIVKRVQKLSGGGYRLISDNKYHDYRDETLVPTDTSNGHLLKNKETGRTVDLRVVGKVIFPRRDTDRLHVKQVAEIIKSVAGGEIDLRKVTP